MRSLVIYGSRSGNTRIIAEAVARGLGTQGTAEILSIDEPGAAIPPGLDLLVIGAPTEGHGVYRPMVEWLDKLAPNACAGMPTATFDTRLDWPKLLSGSAAEGIAGRLERLGARRIASPESFLVTRAPALQPGETARAADWGVSLASMLEGRLAASSR